MEKYREKLNNSNIIVIAFVDLKKNSENKLNQFHWNFYEILI